MQRRATEMIQELGSLPYEEVPQELGLFSLGKRFRRDLITLFPYLKDGWMDTKMKIPL